MSVSETEIDFNEIERSVQKMCNKLGCAVLKTALEEWDAELAASRNRGEYRHKGKRKKVIKTVLGEVEFERSVYETLSVDGKKSFVYLLDEAMGITGSGFMSGVLSEQIVQASCESSYRSAARSVSEMTGQTISHTAAWQVVQTLGERLDVQEHQAARLAAAHKGNGKLETKLLFEEQDGIYLNLQGADRKREGKGKEMKLAVAYDGARQMGKKRYELTNKVACANFEQIQSFVRRKEGVIAATYNTDEIEMRFLNGDGAEWIKRSVRDDLVHFQLDPFHRNRAIRQWVKDPEKKELLFELLNDKRIDDLLGCIEGYMNCLDDTVEEEAVEKENLNSLLTYFTNNKNGLVPCHRRGLDIPKPSGGKEYRRMGTMESNVFTIIGNRMKGRRACWSINGGNNLARLLCLKFTKRLSETLQRLTSCVLPERYTEEIPIIMSTKVPKHEGMGYNGFHQMLIPSAMKELKELAAIRPI